MDLSRPSSLRYSALRKIISIYASHYNWFEVIYCGDCDACMHTRIINCSEQVDILECLEDLARRNSPHVLCDPSYIYDYNTFMLLVTTRNFIDILRVLINDWRINPYLYRKIKTEFPYQIIYTCGGYILKDKTVVLTPWFRDLGRLWYPILSPIPKRTISPEPVKKDIDKADVIDILKETRNAISLSLIRWFNTHK